MHKAKSFAFVALGLLALALLAGLTTPAHPSTDLLATSHYDQGGGTSAASYRSVRYVSFELGYVLGEPTTGPCELPRVGCTPHLVWDVNPGAIFDFGSSGFLNPDTTYFSTIVARLTNGTDESLWSMVRFFDAAGDPLPAGGGSAGPESVVLHRAPDLIGCQVTSIRLKIDTFALTDWTCCGGGLEYNTTYDWSFYGNVPTPTVMTTWGHVKAIYR
jgi:hypothetical protein